MAVALPIVSIERLGAVLAEKATFETVFWAAVATTAALVMAGYLRRVFKRR